MDTTTNATLSDFQIPDAIDDSIQQLKFFPSKNNCYLASCGWDSKLRVWNVQYNVTSSLGNASAQVNSSLLFNTAFAEPLLSVCWQPDSTNIFTGSTDGNIYMVDLNTSKSMAAGKHENGVKEMAWLGNNMNVLVSGGWDGKLHFWDLRQQNPALSLDFNKKIYSMSMAFPLLVVGLQDRIVSYFNMNKLGGTNFGPEASFESHLRYQTRAIAAFPEGNGYAIGSIEGRVAVKYIDLNKQPVISEDTKSMNHPDDFAFRCHRTGENLSEVFAVNTLSFNPIYGTFCTGGGDGSWIIWDKDSRSRLRQGHHNNRSPIISVDYSGNGDLLAYASGYDWSKGIAYEGSFGNKINIHYCPDADKKKKARK